MRTRSTILFLVLAFTTRAQVACDVLSPANFQASFANTWAQPAANSWATPDMQLTANRVIGQLAMAFDGTNADSLCCNAVINGSEISGKVAMLYRGVCDYSEKAKFCQNAGAIAVIIVNNVAGAPPAEMGAGSTGTQVTIPVFQVSAEDGAMLHEDLQSGSAITMLLGNKDGYFATDLGFNKFGVLLPPSLAQSSLLAANAGEFSMEVAAWVHNFGNAPIPDAKLRATIVQNGTSMYDEESATFPLAPGDSVYITLPDHTQAQWSGHYTFTYIASSGTADEHALDNAYNIPLDFGDVYALAPFDPVAHRPISTIGMQPATASSDYESCVHFRNANASRVAITGLDRYVSVNAPATLTGELVLSRVYLWSNNFNVMSDAGFGFDMLVEVHYQKHTLETTNSVIETYLPFSAPVQLEDNARYLVCTNVLNQALFMGYNQSINYATNDVQYDQPTSPNRSGTNWYIGFTGGPVASTGVHLVDANTIGIEERSVVELAPFPNPSKGVFQLMLPDATPATVSVLDASGRVVKTERATGGRLALDLSGEQAGVYMVRVENVKGRAIGRLVLE